MMNEGSNNRVKRLFNVLIFGYVVFWIILMYYRAFFSVDLTDQAYYVAEAKEILNGNIPYAYNNSSMAVGFTFINVVLVAVYRLFSPSLEGIFLFCKLCFVTYKVIVAYIVYRVLKKRSEKAYAILLSGLIIVVDGYMQLFNYNYIPEFNMLLAGCLLYDIIEQKSEYKRLKAAIAGLLTAIGCFANPGWGIALIVFTILIVVRCSEKKDRIDILMFFYCSVIAEVLIVFIPIAVQTSISEVWYGLYRIFIKPIPVDALYPNKNWGEVIDTFKTPIKQWIVLFFPVCIITFCCSGMYYKKTNAEGALEHRITLSITMAMFVHVVFLCCAYPGNSHIAQVWGFIASGYAVLFFIVKGFKNDKIVWYLAVYPPLYAIAEIVILSYGATIGRFVNAYTVFIPVFYILLKNRSTMIRALTVAMSCVLILAYGYVGFHFVYRDDDLDKLTSKVESGVYKGNYTTPARAKDLPELEEYLNRIIGDNETYAFRDNVPCTYMMVHKGVVCEISTWDILQYSYNRNTPAPLFDYYRRRNMIPDKIIYVDFGRDEKLSIEKKGFKYNDWINQYYNLIDDIELNETFYHVMVYQYNGTFNDDYQWWIDNYQKR